MNTNTEAVHFLNSLITNIDLGVLCFDMEGYITMVNSKALAYFNIRESVNNIIDKKILSYIEIEDVVKEISTCLNKSRRDFHFSNIHFNNRYLIVDGIKLLDGMLLSITDVTEKVLAKDKATQSLLLGQEIERRRLSKEIHDGVGPNMSTIKLQLDSIKQKLKDQNAVAALKKVSESISEIAQDIRHISHDLMPSSLIDFGVVTALSNFSNTISSTGDIDVEYHSNIEDKLLSQDYELNIYRIVQELVNNAIKYSNCKSIQINLRLDEDKLRVFVQDDGIGMETNVIQPGNGLHNISIRVESLQGNLEIDSSLGRGVAAHIELPLPALQNNTK